MRALPILWRGLLILTMFVGIGVLTTHVITAHSAPGGTVALNVRMAAAMGGLFAGGAAAFLTGIALFLLRKRVS